MVNGKKGSIHKIPLKALSASRCINIEKYFN